MVEKHIRKALAENISLQIRVLSTGNPGSLRIPNPIFKQAQSALEKGSARSVFIAKALDSFVTQCTTLKVLAYCWDLVPTKNAHAPDEHIALKTISRHQSIVHFYAILRLCSHGLRFSAIFVLVLTI